MAKKATQRKPRTQHKSVFVYGPAACGKTTFAPFLAKHFGCSTVADSEWATGTKSRRDRQRTLNQKANGTGVLFLNIEPPQDPEDGMQVITFFEAMKLACGIDT